MTDIMASLGLVQLRRYPSILARRKEIIEKYNEGLKDLDLSVLNHYGDDFASSGHLYLVRLNGKTREECNAVITKMAEAGVATNVHYKPLPLLTAYKNLGFDIKDYPNAYALFENEITLRQFRLSSEPQKSYEVRQLSYHLIQDHKPQSHVPLAHRQVQVPDQGSDIR